MIREKIRQGLLASALIMAAAPLAAQAEPCKQKDQAERIVCQMSAAKGQAAADKLSAELGKLGEPAVKHIAKVLKESKNGQVRAAVACAVESIGKGAPKLVPALVRVLNDQYAPVRTCALRAVAAIGPAALAALPQVQRCLSHKDIQLQLQALRTLGALWPVAPGAIPQLVKVLDGKRDKRLKYQAAENLARYGALAITATSALRKAMFAPDPKLQGLAVAVVAAMAPASWTELPSLIKLASEKKHDAAVRKAAAAAMAKMGKHGKKHQEAVKKALKSEGAPKAELNAALKAFGK